MIHNMEFHINALYLCVKNMERAIKFYEEFFEQKVTQKDDIYSVLTLEGSLKARNHTGGTAPNQVKKQIEFWQKRLEK